MSDVPDVMSPQSIGVSAIASPIAQNLNHASESDTSHTADVLPPCNATVSIFTTPKLEFDDADVNGKP